MLAHKKNGGGQEALGKKKLLGLGRTLGKREGGSL